MQLLGVAGQGGGWGTGLPWPYSTLSPSLPAWYPHVAAGIWETLRPVEPVLEAHDDAAEAAAGNPVTFSPFGPPANCRAPGAGAPGVDRAAVPTLDALI